MTDFVMETILYIRVHITWIQEKHILDTYIQQDCENNKQLKANHYEIMQHMMIHKQLTFVGPCEGACVGGGAEGDDVGP